ncbi:MAG: hypothetical protein KAU31_08930, partial [Spirochaetaceae bacterium]|nr:hypothetical protein [Spirochaetaceae bacterium]
MVETSNLIELARALELRWRVRIFAGYLATTFTVSAALSLASTLADVLLAQPLPIGRILLIVNGAAIVAALVLTALRQRTPQQLLSDADRVYQTKELLSSAIEFTENGSRRANATEQAFRTMVAKKGEDLSSSVDPATVYPFAIPRRASVAVALMVALGVLLLLSASGWFARPTVELVQEGILLEDAGRRLAEQSGRDELTELADEIRRLGERLRDGELDPEEARRRIEQLGERIEEQMRNLERLGEFVTNQDVEIPPEAEDTIRSALRSGMTEGEVLDFFMSMRSTGETLPDTLKALEDAIPDRPPDANLGIDDERMLELLNRLNQRPENQVPSDLADELRNARQALQQAGVGMQELTAGEEGAAGEAGAGVRSDPEDPDQLPGDGQDTSGEGNSGQQGGKTAVADAMDDTFTRIEEASPVFRHIEGVIGEGTIRDVIIRELPSEAISRMTEMEREVAFERVIEEAVGRENTPPELQHLVRNYFLRITLGKDQG